AVRLRSVGARLPIPDENRAAELDELLADPEADFRLAQDLRRALSRGGQRTRVAGADLRIRGLTKSRRGGRWRHRHAGFQSDGARRWIRLHDVPGRLGLHGSIGGLLVDRRFRLRLPERVLRIGVTGP